jgi:predicted SAM-dependent methyltransferase
VGLDFELLSYFLREAGFKDVKSVSEFNLFNDCSQIRVLGQLISLNVIAIK